MQLGVCGFLPAPFGRRHFQLKLPPRLGRVDQRQVHRPESPYRYAFTGIMSIEHMDDASIARLDETKLLHVIEALGGDVCDVTVAVVVRGSRMYLRLTADGRSADMLFDGGKAERFRRRHRRHRAASRRRPARHGECGARPRSSGGPWPAWWTPANPRPPPARSSRKRRGGAFPSRPSS